MMIYYDIIWYYDIYYDYEWNWYGGEIGITWQNLQMLWNHVSVTKLKQNSFFLGFWALRPGANLTSF